MISAIERTSLNVLAAGTNFKESVTVVTVTDRRNVSE
jgi:hypothetical protein